jgi:hypothetical protein
VVQKLVAKAPSVSLISRTMTRLGQRTTEKKGSKKALREAGRKIAFRGRAYVSERMPAPAVVVTKAERMKEPWCIAATQC